MRAKLKHSWLASGNYGRGGRGRGGSFYFSLSFWATTELFQEKSNFQVSHPKESKGKVNKK